MWSACSRASWRTAATSPATPFSLADVHLGPHLDMLSDCSEGAEMLKDTPLAGWLERLNARPSFAATTWDRVAEAAKASMAAA
jgi:hypothetical protein